MKKLKTAFKALAVLILILIVGVIATGVYVFHHPRETWALIEKHFLPQDLKITWDELSFQTPSAGHRRWEPEISFQTLCIRKQDPKVDVCADRLQVGSFVNFESLFHPQVQVRKVLLASQYHNYFLPSPEKKEPKKDEQNFHEMAITWRDRLKLYSKWMDIEQVDINIEHFELRSKQALPLVMSASVTSPHFLEATDFSFKIEKEKSFQTEVSGNLSLKNWMQGKDSVLQSKAQMKFAKGNADLSDIAVSWNETDSLQVSAKGFLKFADIKVDSHLISFLKEKEFAGELSTHVKGLKKPFQDIKPFQAKFSIPQEKGRLWAKKNAEANVVAYAPLFFVTPGLRAKLEKTCKCEIPQELKATVNAEASLRNYFQAEDEFIAMVHAQAQSLKNSLLNTDVKANLEIVRKEDRLEFAPYIDAFVQVTSFQGLALFMKEYKIGVPAPLSELNGKITVKAQGPLDRSLSKWTIPVAANVDLSSKQQRVDVTSDGTVTVDLPAKWIDADIRVLLKSVVLQLPPLDPIYGIPKVTPDRRFQVKPPVAQQKKSAFKFNLSLQVRSQQSDSIRLLYYLADPWIPVGLSLDYKSGSAIKGQLTLHPFSVEYLRRKLTVENFQAELNQPVGNFPAKGRFRINQALYKIYIDVLGNLTKPQVVLSSDPYLDRSDIISVLLYGRPNDQLVSADAKTVGSFDAAVADRAIGLLGLWALSSTPIQSFSYNQLSQQYSAQLKITDDTSLSVGTNWEQAASLELQKRLSDRWMISAGVEPNEEDQQTRKLRLQWEDRF